MRGDLEDISVFIRDVREASQIYSKGCFGYPLSGGQQELDLVEAVFLVAHERLDIFKENKKQSFSDLFEYASALVPGFDIKYLVYRDLRERGFIVKQGSGNYDFHVYDRGMQPSDGPPKYLVSVASESTPTDFAAFSKEITAAEDMGKKLLYGVADAEGDITYYRMNVIDPHGPFTKSADGNQKGSLVGDRVFVYDGIVAEKFRQEANYGKNVGDLLQLSLIEACYLVDNNELEVYDVSGKKIEKSKLMSLGNKTQESFDCRYTAYSDLRKRGLLVKAGFKYGVHFRLYDDDIDKSHARYLVHAVPKTVSAIWPEISRIVRLSGGVRKEILFCRVGEGIEYLSFSWFKP